jgi:hypothetical protein
MTNPCAYLNYSYNQEELADFSKYCLEKYKKDFFGETRSYPWTGIKDREDSQKFKKILQNLFDIFESIGQPLVANEPKIFWSLPGAYGMIHKDPIGFKGSLLNECSKWACNIPAVDSSLVDLEFFDNTLDQQINFEMHENVNQRYGMPNFYQKYLGQNLDFGQRPEEQTDPIYTRPFTKSMILDTTQWHRTRSYSDKLSIRIQYFTYWDLQKSYQQTLVDLSKHLF